MGRQIRPALLFRPWISCVLCVPWLTSPHRSAMVPSCVGAAFRRVSSSVDWLDKISQFWPHIAAGFDLLAALLGSAHVLLHKRDTRAATLWIGIIWLMPLVGPVLYLVLGFNRIRRRAISLGVHGALRRASPENLGEPNPAAAAHLKMLASVVNRVVARSLTTGNQFQAL